MRTCTMNRIGIVLAALETPFAYRAYVVIDTYLPWASGVIATIEIGLVKGPWT